MNSFTVVSMPNLTPASQTSWTHGLTCSLANRIMYDVFVCKAYDTSESFLSKVAFKRKLSNVAYTLAEVFTSESQLSQIERVLFLKVFFRIQ